MKPFPKAGKAGVKTTTVMFVPSSKGGLLTKMMKEREDVLVDMTRFRIKIQEAGGVKLKNMFSTDLAAGEHCSREDCMPCNDSEKKQNCKRQSILYESSCQICNKEQSHRPALWKEGKESTTEKVHDPCTRGA
jgi:hypothetical protein